jgi:hypothetical protein
MASESVSADLTLCFFAGEESEGGAARFVEVLKTILVCEDGRGGGFGLEEVRVGVWVMGVCHMCPWGLSALKLRSSVAFPTLNSAACRSNHLIHRENHSAI